MKIGSALSLLLWGIFFPASAPGQQVTTGVAEVRIDLWPEYDRRAVLVMYRFRVLDGEDLSVPVSVPVPAGVGEPHAVAWRNDEGKLFVAEFTRQVEEDRTFVLARLGSRDGQLEFYTDITFDGRLRSFRFEWPGGIEVGSLSFQVQEPAGATSLQMTPPPVRQWEGEDGLGYAAVELGRQASSATPAIEVSYQKDSDKLTAGETGTSAIPAAPSASTGRSTESATEEDTGIQSLPWWLIGLGGIVLGGALAAFALVLVQGRGAEVEAPSATVPRETRKTKGNAGPKSESESSFVFCHQCGTKAKRTHAFCMNCGTKLVLPRS